MFGNAAGLISRIFEVPRTKAVAEATSSNDALLTD
jgi:hypothetical protein